MPVAYTEPDGSPQQVRSTSGFRAVRKLKCAWASRDTLALELLNTDYPLVADTGAYCREVSADPWPAKQLGTGSTAAYEFAEVTAIWETRRGAAADLKYERLEPASEFLTLDGTQLKWADGTAFGSMESPGKLCYQLNYVVTLYNLATIPAAALSLMNYVNAEPLTPTTAGLGSLIFAAGTLLCCAIFTERVITTAGSDKWDVTYTFAYRPNWNGATATGWNYLFRPSTNLYELFYRKSDDGQSVMYPSGDFTALNPL